MKASPSVSQKSGIDFSTTRLLLSHLYVIYLKELGAQLDGSKNVKGEFLEKYVGVLYRGMWKPFLIPLCVFLLILCSFFGAIYFPILHNFLMPWGFVGLAMSSLFMFNGVFDGYIKKMEMACFAESLNKLSAWRVRVLLSLGVKLKEKITESDLNDLLLWLNDFVADLNNRLISGMDMDMDEFYELRNALEVLEGDLSRLESIVKKEGVSGTRRLIAVITSDGKDGIPLNDNLISALKKLLDSLGNVLRLTSVNINADVYDDVLSHLKETNGLPDLSNDLVVLSDEQIKRNEKLLKLISST